MTELPAGALTFLFTDLEGSTRLWEEHPDAMQGALARHDEILRGSVEAHNGQVVKTTGDGIHAVFPNARDALDAAVVMQRALAAEPFGDTGPLLVRMGLHTCEAERRDGDYYGSGVNRAARLMAAGHGGQILVGAATAALVDGVDFVDLGERRLRDLSEPLSIFQVRAEGLLVEFPPLSTMDTVPGNLPAQATSFIGREADVAAVDAALHANRVVTLVGVGGVGKTRLALQAAAEVLGDYRDGAWLVELAPILDAADLTQSVAAVFGITPHADRSRRDDVIESLRGRQLLLVLDNCEHVLDEAATLTEAVIANCPGVTILATSREALGVVGESAWPVRSLDLGRGSSATALFVERARAVAPGFDPDDDVETVAEICRRLDGIPLAIELAAARIRSMSPTQIRDRLDERFRLLTGSRRSSDRHQTLRNAVQWSYDLLDEIEQRVLQRAAVFVGGFSIAAAAEVCGPDRHGDLDEFEMLDIIDSLVRKSLVAVERTSTELRYNMLETIRQFAEEHLAESAESEPVRDRHAAYFADRAEAAFEAFRSPREDVAYRFIDDEMANLRAAFRWSVDRGLADPAIRIAACSHEIARFRLRTETFGWPAEVADLARRVEHRQLPLLLSMACDSSWGLGSLEEAKQFGHEAIALAHDTRYEPFLWAYCDLARIAMFEGDIDTSLELLREGAAHPADRQDRIVLAVLHWYYAIVGERRPDDEFDEAMAQINAAGVPWAISFSLTGQAELAAERDIAAAVELQQQAVDLLEACGNRLYALSLRARLVTLLARGDDPDRALASFVDIVNAWRINGDTVLAAGITQLAVLLARLGYHEGATRLYGAATRSVTVDALVPELDATMAAAREAMGDTAFRAECDIGAALSYQSAADLACELIALARAEFIERKDS